MEYPGIHFSNYSQIKVEQKPQVGIIRKHKFTIVSIIFFILIIILVVVIAIRNNQIKSKEEELSKIDKELNEQKINILNYEQNFNEIEITKNNLLNNLTYINFEISNIQSEYNSTKTTNFKLLYTKNDLNAHKEYINNKIKYIEKCSKKDELNKEIFQKNEIYQKMLQRLNDLSILNSNIITNLDEFKRISKVEILNKCYDNIIYDFNVNMFHENCDGYPLIILIKTKKGEKIGAFTSISNDLIKNIKDDKSMLINFDKNEYYLYNMNNKDCFVYSRFDEFPKFGNDLAIYRNGTGEILGNDCYKINEIKNEYLIEEKKFEIEFMEIYKIKL